MENKNEKYKEAINRCDQLIASAHRHLEYHRKMLLCYERKKRRIEKLIDQNQGTRLNGAAKKKGIDIDALLEAIERGDLDGFKLKPKEEENAAEVSDTDKSADTAVSGDTTSTENNENTEEKEHGNSKHKEDTGSAG